MKTIFKYGLISALSLTIISALLYFVSKDMDFAAQEVVGYLSIFIALSFVFFGVKAYRDKEKGGQITFFKAFGVGLLITIFPSLVFGLYNAIYVLYLDPGFADAYAAAEIVKAQEMFSGAELTAKIEEIEAMKEFAASPVLGSLLMFFTVFLIGIVVSVITAVALRKK